MAACLAVSALSGVCLSGCRRAPEAAPINARVSKETFAKITPGMSQWEVKDLFGDSGQLLSSEGTRTVTNGKESVESTEVYTWRSGPDAFITVVFANGKVANKEAGGLP